MRLFLGRNLSLKRSCQNQVLDSKVLRSLGLQIFWCGRGKFGANSASAAKGIEERIAWESQMRPIDDWVIPAKFAWICCFPADSFELCRSLCIVDKRTFFEFCFCCTNVGYQKSQFEQHGYHCGHAAKPIWACPKVGHRHFGTRDSVASTRQNTYYFISPIPARLHVSIPVSENMLPRRLVQRHQFQRISNNNTNFIICVFGLFIVD